MHPAVLGVLAITSLVLVTSCTIVECGPYFRAGRSDRIGHQQAGNEMPTGAAMGARCSYTNMAP